MAIVASLPGLNLFSSLPTNPPPDKPTSHSPPKPPIPIPKYPPPQRSRKPPPPKTKNTNPAFKTFHHRSKYYKPVREGVISSNGDRAVVVGESGVSYRLPGAPFEFQFSYSETPKAKPVAIREPAFLPFAPPTMPRPWTGKAPMKKAKKNIPLFDSFNSPPEESGGVKYLEMPAPYKLGNFSPELKPREEVLGKPLTRLEIRELLKPHISSNRQVNLGRDGLTHNMLELIHSHWRRGPICKVRCLGVPTVDMNNVCRCLEEKTDGKIIHRVGGVVYLFRGRNYDHRTRPQYPVMLWKPATPVYPKLIQETPEGLTKAEADELRMKGKILPPMCKLAKNGVYNTLVRDVRSAFEECHLAKINCIGMHASDYKRIGAKLKELVPCVLLSFDDEQILMWRGHSWKSMYQHAPTPSSPNVGSRKSDSRTVSSSPKMMSLWKGAIESSKALLLDEIGLGPDDLLEKVEEFERVSQATVHSYPAMIVSGESDGDQESDEDENYTSDNNDESYLSESFQGDGDSSFPMGTLPVDLIAKQFSDSEERN